MTYFFLSLIIGVSTAILVWAVFMLEKDLSPNVLRRLDRIKRKTNETDDSIASNVLDLVMHDTEYQIKALGEVLKKYKLSEQIKELIQLSGSKVQIDTFIFLSLACAAPFLFFLFTPIKLMCVAGIGAIFLPTFYLRQLANQRYMDFSKQFPDALNLMASSLRAGHPLFSAIDIVTEEMPKPLCEVFETTKKDLSLGIDTKDAFLSMTKAMPQSIDLRFFITAVLVQKEVGGNLAELLDSLSSTIRERFKLLGQLKVQTAQTRISGVVLSIVPVAVLMIIAIMNPAYMEPMFKTTEGQMALALAVGLIIAGFVAIKKISDIEV